MNENTGAEQYVRIGNLIKNRREFLNLSQQEVAEYVEVSKSAISRWESGEVENMGRSKIQKLSEILKVSPVSIVLGEEVNNVLPFRTKRVPLMGEIPAGEPMLVSEEHIEYYIEADASLHVDFCLRVKGDSMIDARINDGDIVFVRKQPVVENGEIAAVAIDNEVTLKRFYKNNGGVILKPENSKYQPRFFTAEDFKNIRVLGKAVFFQSTL